MPGVGGITFGLPGCVGQRCVNAGDAANSTGSGGGGGASQNGWGGSGGSGVVILRFRGVEHTHARVDSRVLAFTDPGRLYRIHVSQTITASLLAVGGGGGGGNRASGGGGGGGVLWARHVSIPEGTYDVRVGDGGMGQVGTGKQMGQNGGDTTAFGGVAKGGGAGGCAYNNYCSGANGGSGGGSQVCVSLPLLLRTILWVGL